MRGCDVMQVQFELGGDNDWYEEAMRAQLLTQDLSGSVKVEGSEVG